MRLSTILETDFPSGVRQRGREYFHMGRVEIANVSQDGVTALVQGSRRYSVRIGIETGDVDFSCECPYFYDTGECKHIWATVLECDSRGLFEITKAASPAPSPKRSKAPEPEPRWRQQIAEVGKPGSYRVPEHWPERRQLLYVIDLHASALHGCFEIELITRERSKQREDRWNAPKELRWARADIPALPDAADREILSLLAGAQHTYGWGLTSYDPIATHFALVQPLAGKVIPAMARTGRLYIRSGYREEPFPLAWDEGEPWGFELRLGPDGKDRWAINGVLRRGEESCAASEVEMVCPGFVLRGERLAFLDPAAPFAWIDYLRRNPAIAAPARERNALLASLLESSGTPRVIVPDELQFEECAVDPQPCLHIRNDKQSYTPRLTAELSFDYAGLTVQSRDPRAGLYDAERRRFTRRDQTAENAAAARLRELGVRVEQRYAGDTPRWSLAPAKLPAVARTLMEERWRLEADGKAFRRPATPRVQVTSGVDWFELRGEVDYEGVSAQLPALLEALRRGENLVRLDDGTYGFLPEEWLARFGPVAGLGESAGGHLRFRRNQAGLLDALLAAQPEAHFDEGFARIREELRRFDGIHAAEQPAGFAGELRGYQREGLGWMQFLRTFGFGGCLADDMGVGKTAQVLALLESRRALRGTPEGPGGPSLAVVPRSLVFNWKQEVQRFTPQLRVVDHTGAGRNTNGFHDCDLVLTTYGTLRRDAPSFRDIDFDYIILDEAQCVKNANTESAKAVRLLRGRQRLALSGTPVENHLGELWSLFEFLNPGMLGSASVFRLAGGNGRNPGEETRKLLAHALRPFILRRTKQQVARELPEKTEQTIYCDLEPPQRRLYNELRAHYRYTLLNRIDKQGMGKSKMHVLEALLRLRQAACHPGLLDPKRASESSVKFEVLLEQLAEVLEEGHKALVFSQFTTLLGLLKERLDERGIVYEYLDGQTRDRQACVERFQTDPACPLFLISLKAGGLGLNLTAAEYVFLLDPWWNPAVEAQAIDRTHRIGQTQQVFAYRLIARDTVEEKVLELQNTKRELADAILGASEGVIANLRREDIEMLLS